MYWLSVYFRPSVYMSHAFIWNMTPPPPPLHTPLHLTGAGNYFRLIVLIKEIQSNTYVISYNLSRETSLHNISQKRLILQMYKCRMYAKCRKALYILFQANEVHWGSIVQCSYFPWNVHILQSYMDSIMAGSLSFAGSKKSHIPILQPIWQVCYKISFAMRGEHTDNFVTQVPSKE